MIFLPLSVHRSVTAVYYPQENFLKTNKRLFALNIKKDDILKIIRKLNVNKAHGHDDISIRMLKICDSVITEPLSIIFKNY